MCLRETTCGAYVPPPLGDEVVVGGDRSGPAAAGTGAAQNCESGTGRLSVEGRAPGRASQASGTWRKHRCTVASREQVVTRRSEKLQRPRAAGG